MDHIPFLREEFALIVVKGLWGVLPCLVAKELPGLRLIALGSMEENYRRPKWIGYYSYSNLNAETLTIAALYTMQYGRMLDRLIREVVITEPALGPIYVYKADVSNRFNCTGMKPKDITKLGLLPP